MITTYASYSMISRDLPGSLARVAEKPDVARETEYYLANIGRIKSVDDFMADSRIYNYALKAHGLEDMAYAKAFIRKVLTEGVADDNAFARKLADSRYASLAETFNFEAFGSSATSFEKAQKGVVERFQRQTLEEEAGAENPGVRLALYFERMAPSIKSGMEILADDALVEVVRTVLQLPDEIAALDLDRQVEFIEEAVDIADFQDPAKVSKFLERFSALWEMENRVEPVSAVSLFSPSTQGISADLLISINALKLGGK
ncbi:hypothetical protein REJC140_02263 [Pseudorhizobium endolithicum]|uniref:Flagellar basal-body rod protein FlgF n=1 Tax=Pseudorhizobium endolithicum TaxID=1191678 RepID=A0ABN7K4D4_9HYPH|nr:DUF1217 domain-containing protein [Pseudorhizobium endolithicum]CAD6425297.1 hypothetical protein REQ54_02729 [Rhizobium sp. Q54]CAD7055004.1 hypothetical protein REJC140_02263 [Pseudorhizobium endolithicum]